jgi:hypothetical protein
MSFDFYFYAITGVNRGRHLLDGLEVVAPWKHARRLCVAPVQACEGHCARPAGIAKSNSSRARREERQVVRPGQVLVLVL